MSWRNFFTRFNKIFKNWGKKSKPAPKPTPPITPSKDPVLEDSEPPPTPKPKPKMIYKIGLSPGHGGTNKGAVSTLGAYEKDLAREVCDQLKYFFLLNSAFDVAVYDYEPEKKQYGKRVRESNNRGDHYYIPIHFNDFSSKTKNGWLIFVDPADAESSPALRPLCISVLEALTDLKKIGYGDWDGEKDGYMEGLGERKIYEMTYPKADTVYLELGYISNPAWAEYVSDPRNIRDMARAVVTGFEEFFKVKEFRGE